MLEIEAFVILASIKGLSAVKIRQLVDFFGSAVAAVNAPASQQLPGFEQISSWQQNTLWRQDLDLVAKYGVNLIPYTSPHYPKALLSIPNSPPLLYVLGTLTSQDSRSIAIVGTRQASVYGNTMAAAIGQDLAAQGFTVVSGLAHGIDTSAHRGALTKGRTLAVIGSGLADLYPRENLSLAKEIAQQGALISEFPMRTPPDRQNFPQRNRIVSGLALGTVLIEAPIKSGAMITMEKAYQHRRKLFALPGRADDEAFRGNHAWIKSGKARLVENAGDVMAHFEELFHLKH